jgi:hypothetical protein
MTDVEWTELQETYHLGELLMPCCDAPAVPKTSPLGLQFFAHAAGKCGGAPESIWHQRAKEAVAEAAGQLGLDVIIERPGNGWKADVWIDTSRGPVVVECQHSYQHLREYLARHMRYSTAGIDCLWLVIDHAYRTMSSSAARHRLRTDLKDVKTWPLDQGTLIRDFPVCVLSLDGGARVLGQGLAAELSCLLAAFVDRRFVYDRGKWVLVGDAEPRQGLGAVS